MAEKETRLKENTQEGVREKLSVEELDRIIPTNFSSFLEGGETIKMLFGPKGMNDPKNEGARLKVTHTENDVPAEKIYQRRLEIILGLVEKSKDAGELAEKVENKRELLRKTFKENMKNVFLKQRQLEQTYRELDIFYDNAKDQDQVYICNASLDKHFDKLLDKTAGLLNEDEGLPTEFHFDMKQLYGIIAAPGWIGGKANFESRIKQLGELAKDGMAHVFTDFIDIDREEAYEDFANGPYRDLKAGGEGNRYKQYISMTGDRIRVRKSNMYEGDETKDLYINPSIILSGIVANENTPDYVTIAEEDYKINIPTPDGSKPETKWKLISKKQTKKFDDALIPVAVKGDILMFYGAGNLYKEQGTEDKGMGQYAVKRCDEYISKSLLYFLNNMTFKPNDFKLRKDIRDSIGKFLINNVGDDKMLQKGRVLKVDAVPGNQKELNVEIEVAYKQAVRTLNLILHQEEEDDSVTRKE